MCVCVWVGVGVGVWVCLLLLFPLISSLFHSCVLKVTYVFLSLEPSGHSTA